MTKGDPRRDKEVLKYDKDSINKIIGDQNSGTSEFYQLISMFVGIYAFMMKVRLGFDETLGQMGGVVLSLLLLHLNPQHASRKQVPADLHRYRVSSQVSDTLASSLCPSCLCT